MPEEEPYASYASNFICILWRVKGTSCGYVVIYVQNIYFPRISLPWKKCLQPHGNAISVCLMGTTDIIAFSCIKNSTKIFVFSGIRLVIRLSFTYR